MTTKQREDWLAQVRRGLLELCVLALTDQQATYGYEMVTRLARTPQLATLHQDWAAIVDAVRINLETAP